jgi:N-methylhydantoinase B
VSTRFDAIALEVLWTRLISVVDEAAKAIVRTSFSTLSNEANDFACVLTDARGFALAQNSGSIPSFIGTLPATVRHFLREIGTARMRPGDVLITNDPWQGTGHMSDVSLVKPIFLRERLVAFSATTAHMPDIGGRIRAIEARELFEEGLHIPLTHLMRDGRADETLLTLLRANVRTPDQTVGDIWAQVSANELMESRVRRLMEEYALDSLEELGDELYGRSERAMREAIRAVPDGTYRYEMETDGFEAPYRFRIALSIRGDEIVADFTGTSPAQPRAINCVMAYTYAMTAYAVRCALLPGLPNNEGMYRPVKVEAPEGCLLNPRFPAAVVSRAQTGHYVPILVLGALHQVIPDRVAAAAGSPLWVVAQSGVRDDGRPYTAVLFFNGGMGATAHKDGEHVLSWPSNISSTPVEVAERNSPLFFHYKRMRAGSGGRGRFRGGVGQDMLIESESKRPIVMAFMAERTRFAAPGLAGGGAGGLGDVRINGKKVDHRRQHVLERGDRLLVSTPGGGGYGSAAARPHELRERDRRLGYVRPPSPGSPTLPAPRRGEGEAEKRPLSRRVRPGRRTGSPGSRRSGSR